MDFGRALLAKLEELANQFRGLQIVDPDLKAKIEFQLGVIATCWAAPVEVNPEEPESIKEFVEDLQHGIQLAKGLQQRLSPDELALLYPQHDKVIKRRDEMSRLRGFWWFLHDEIEARVLNEFEMERLCGKFLGIDIVEYRAEHVRMVNDAKEKKCQSSTLPPPSHLPPSSE
jgi:hypothetical protein